MRVEDAVRIRHMIGAAESALRFIAGRKREDLEKDEMLQFALAVLAGFADPTKSTSIAGMKSRPAASRFQKSSYRHAWMLDPRHFSL